MTGVSQSVCLHPVCMISLSSVRASVERLQQISAWMNRGTAATARGARSGWNAHLQKLQLQLVTLSPTVSEKPMRIDEGSMRDDERIQAKVHARLARLVQLVAK